MKLFFDVVVVVVCLEPAACRALLLLCSVEAKPKTLKKQEDLPQSWSWGEKKKIHSFSK